MVLEVSSLGNFLFEFNDRWTLGAPSPLLALCPYIIHDLAYRVILIELTSRYSIPLKGSWKAVHRAAMSPLTRSKKRAQPPPPSLYPTKSTKRIQNNLPPPQPLLNGHQGLDAQSSPSRLLDLPAEIRLEIFAVLLGGRQSTPACVCEGGERRRNEKSPLYGFACRGGMGWSPQVLRLNKQIYSECHSIMYSNRVFKIRVHAGVIMFCGFHFLASERGHYSGGEFDHLFEVFGKIERIDVEILPGSNQVDPEYSRVIPSVSYSVELLRNVQSLKDLRIYIRYVKSDNTPSIDGTRDCPILQPFHPLGRIETVGVEGKSLQCVSIFSALY